MGRARAAEDRDNDTLISHLCPQPEKNSFGVTIRVIYGASQITRGSLTVTFEQLLLLVPLGSRALESGWLK
jgi:hypothetical protein